MSYIALARKYRPQNFDEIVGQGHVAQTLKNAIQQNRISHSYLFSGPRGVGKTSSARILAKCLNCEKGPTVSPCGKCSMCREIAEGNSLDILEIDAASNTQVDKIRDLIEKVKFSSGAARYKMYIIDEVHMLSESSFNALLKTIEEPPAHVIFVLATTAPYKIPETIISRCQWFVFKRILVSDMIKYLADIAKKEKIKISENALYAVARHSEGSMRDAEVSLDQIISFSGDEIKDDDVDALLGVIKLDYFHRLIDNIAQKDVSQAVKLINIMIESGYEVEAFLKGLQEYLRNLIVLKDQSAQTSNADLELIDLPKEEIIKEKQQSALFSQDAMAGMIDVAANAQRDIRQFGSNGQEKLILELMAIKLIMQSGIKSVQAKETSENIKIQPKQEYVAPKAVDPIIKKEEKVIIKEQTRNIFADEIDKKSENPKDKTEIVPEKPGSKDIVKKWQEAVEKIKKEKISLGGFLETCEIKEYKEKVMTVFFGESQNFHKERAEARENKIIIETILSEIFGERIKLEYVKKQEGHIKQVHQKQADSEDPMVKQILNTLGGNIVDRKKIDGK